MKVKPKILIVDDKGENLVALEKTLADLNVDFVRATSGNDALAVTLEQEFALALVDVQMPGMDGFETVELMRQDKKTRHIPIIFISAIYTEEYHKIKGIETGAIDFITKPINPKIVLGKVRIFLELHEYKRSLEEQNKIITASHKELQIALDELGLMHEELVKSQEQLVQSQKLAAIGQLVSGIAHEINNPLMAISGNAQLLLEDAEDEDTLESLEVIRCETQRATDIVQNLLAFARSHKSDRDLVSINEVVENAVKLCSNKSKIDNIQIVYDFTSDMPNINIDSLQIQQVFLNLINNAIQAMTKTKDSGKLIIRTQQPSEETVQISFEDDGPGIPAENIDRVFEPFFTTKDIGEGTGLGLSICYGIIQSHNGKIYAESTESNGATFNIELPIIDDTSNNQSDIAVLEPAGATQDTQG
ncbi:MAG: response regulator [Chloroflexi bacterium]|nr:response regulator [Chloroflexota bacterium]